jgi:hypothetical protein
LTDKDIIDRVTDGGKTDGKDDKGEEGKEKEDNDEEREDDEKEDDDDEEELQIPSIVEARSALQVLSRFFVMRGRARADELLLFLEQELEQELDQCASAEMRQTRIRDFFKKRGESV